MSKLHVYKNGTEWVVAESPEDCRVVAAKYFNDCDLDDDERDFEFEQEPDDKQITIQNYNDDGESATRTCAEFAAESGRGLLCSTEW